MQTACTREAARSAPGRAGSTAAGSAGNITALKIRIRALFTDPNSCIRWRGSQEPAMRTSRHQCQSSEGWKIHMEESKQQQKKRLTECHSGEPPKVKILFYSLTRINGIRKKASMNDPEKEES